MLKEAGVKLPKWVKEHDGAKAKSTRNAEKLRKNQPKEEVVEEPAVEEAAAEPVAETVAEETPAETDEPAAEDPKQLEKVWEYYDKK